MKKLNNEERDLLVKDLLPRLFYGVKAEIYEDGGSITEQLYMGGLDHLWHGTLNVIPYLRPMSSMTNKEMDEVKDMLPFHNGGLYIDRFDIQVLEGYVNFNLPWHLFPDIIDWLNTHHFDYRGLIEKGLALEAPKDMYK